MYPYAELLAVVQDAPNASAGWSKLLDLCGRHWPSPLWKQLVGIEPHADVRAAVRWLQAEIADWLQAQRPQEANSSDLAGFVFALDTLNMDQGTNVSLASTVDTDIDPGDQGMSWLGCLDWDGSSHLIHGLKTMETIYGRQEWEELPAEYVLFLVYSGLVLAEAATLVQWPSRTIVVWGFHDGDLFVLGQAGPKGFGRAVAELPKRDTEGESLTAVLQEEAVTDDQIEVKVTAPREPPAVVRRGIVRR